MAGSTTEAQLDFLREADGMTRLRGCLRKAADRYGIPELAHRLDIDESTLRNQLDYRRRQDKSNGFWKPSADCVLALLLDDRRFREDVLSVNDERIEDVEPVEPLAALRDIYVKAQSNEWGTAARQEIAGLYRRVKKARP
jgi:hypothetical protein